MGRLGSGGGFVASALALERRGHLDGGPAAVVTADAANPMLALWAVALGTLVQARRGQRVMGAALVAAAA